HIDPDDFGESYPELRLVNFGLELREYSADRRRVEESREPVQFRLHDQSRLPRYRTSARRVWRLFVANSEERSRGVHGSQIARSCFKSPKVFVSSCGARSIR